MSEITFELGHPLLVWQLFTLNTFLSEHLHIFFFFVTLLPSRIVVNINKLYRLIYNSYEVRRL